MREDLREIGPHVMIAPAALLGGDVLGVPGEDRRRRARQARGDARWRSPSASGWRERQLRRQPRRRRAWRLLGGLAHLLAFRAMLDKLGLSRVRYAYTGGAPLGPEIFHFFRAIGLNLKQVYGQTESSGICVLHPDGDVRAETVGKPDAGHARSASPTTGEILISSDSVFLGYYKNPEATAQALDGRVAPHR